MATCLSYPGPAWGVEKIRDSNQAQEPFLFINYVQVTSGYGVICLCISPLCLRCHYTAVSKIPFGLNCFHLQLFLVMGVAMPLLVTIYTFLTSDSGPIAAAVLPPYILTLIVQVLQENNFIKKSESNDFLPENPGKASPFVNFSLCTPRRRVLENSARCRFESLFSWWV